MHTEFRSSLAWLFLFIGTLPGLVGCSTAPPKAQGTVDIVTVGYNSSTGCDVCTGAVPHCLSLGDTQFCVACTTDADCAAQNAGTCLKSMYVCSQAKPPECAICADPLPACLVLGGSWFCAGCVSDVDCANQNAGKCEAPTFVCSGKPSPSAKCIRDLDCIGVTTGAFDLACDVTSGVCYDRNGRCDNKVAFCKISSGSQCQLAADATPSESFCSCATPACDVTPTAGSGGCWDGVPCVCTGQSSGPGTGQCGKR